MRFFWITCSCVFLLAVAGLAQTNPAVVIQTELGDITLELYPEQAPVTVSNFLNYVDARRYGGATFYRVVTMDNQPKNKVKIEVVQGGLAFTEKSKSLPPIVHETTKETGIRHLDGTVSMARSRPGTASSEFFICIGDQPELDYNGRRNPDNQGFAAFGRVISGMDLVRKIQIMPSENQMLDERVRIRNIVRQEK